VATIAKACAVLKNRKKSKNRGVDTTHFRPLRPVVCIMTGFFITRRGNKTTNPILRADASKVTSSTKRRLEKTVALNIFGKLTLST